MEDAQPGVHNGNPADGQPDGDVEEPEAVEKWGNLDDWHHAIGTGPFILKDFVSGISATLVKNPNYWGYDERYPQNKLPYIDTRQGISSYLMNAAALAALRAGKIDVIDHISAAQAQEMRKTNPEILQIAHSGFRRDYPGSEK